MQPDQLSLIKNNFRSLYGYKSSLMFVGGLFLVLILSSLVAWKDVGFWRHQKVWPLLILNTIAYCAAIHILNQFQRLPKSRIIGPVLFSVSVVFVVVIVVITYGRFYYSRSFILVAYGLTVAFLLFAFELRGKSKVLRLAVVPGGMASDLLSLQGVEWVYLQKPELSGRVEGVVVDWHVKLSAEWVRLLSICSLRRLPVYHAAVVFETSSGKISLAHLSEGLIDDFCFSPFYAAFKRLVDVTIVIALAPIALPLAAILALVIRLDSSGPVLYWQERVGQGGRPFRMCKFRSMHLPGKEGSACFTERGDRRITNFGRLIRTLRLDELPQFWNVIKGEMSLIGPRPEQVPFARKFENEIAFYGYRHLVKPGITGWAQVNRGYASGTEEARDKLEWDLYYIKYFSLWLDALILIKTIRTILTGFGAR